MLVTKYNPFSEFRNFSKNLDMFNEMMNTLEPKTQFANIAEFKPKVNTVEGESAYHIEVDLPGVKKEDINVDVEDNILTISGERKIKEEKKEEDYYRVESSYGKFSRSFTLPQKVDIENIHANTQDGVLEVVIPKLDLVENKSKKIDIK